VFVLLSCCVVITSVVVVDAVDASGCVCLLSVMLICVFACVGVVMVGVGVVDVVVGVCGGHGVDMCVDIGGAGVVGGVDDEDGKYCG